MKRYTEERMIKGIKRHEAGFKVDEIGRDLGISAGTFYNWRSITLASKSMTRNATKH